MLSPLAVSLVALLAVPQSPDDPEQHPAGRTHYLGREVARTMHWTGAPWLMRATREDEENGTLLRESLSVEPGQVICDLGCGNGYHTLPLAAAVGRTGKVFAVDLQAKMLVLLRQRMQQQQLDNIAFVEATVDDPKLPPASCDLVLLVDVYHELSHPVRVMAHVRRALRPGGRVVLVEFRSEDPDVPIKPEHKMSKAQVVREMAAHGFELAADFDGLPWQHAMTFAPAAAAGPRFAPRQFVRAFLRAAAHDDPRAVAPFLAPGSTKVDLPVLSADHRQELRAGPEGSLLATLRTAAGERLAHDRDEVVLRRDQEGRWHISAVRARQPVARAHGGRRCFVAMHTALGGGTVAQRVGLAHELEFDGVAWSLDRLTEVRRECEARGGDLLSAYAVLDLDEDRTASLPPVRAAIDALAAGPGMLWLALRHGSAAAGDPAGEEAATAALRSLLQHARTRGVEIALYPHHGFWLENTEQALGLCARIDQPQLGVCFNLCHFLRNHDADDPAPLLRRCGPRLFAVTIHGADRAGTDWSTLIRPLGEGDFDLRAFVLTLDAIGFDGPIGLQGYGIKRPAREHLTASMAAWRAAQSAR